MTNARRQNLQFGYGEDDDATPPECAAVWDYLKTLEPSLYLELHSYPHLNRPSFRPYVWDLDLFTEKRSREIAERFYALLDAVSPPAIFSDEGGNGVGKAFSLVSGEPVDPPAGNSRHPLQAAQSRVGRRKLRSRGTAIE